MWQAYKAGNHVYAVAPRLQTPKLFFPDSLSRLAEFRSKSFFLKTSARRSSPAILVPDVCFGAFYAIPRGQMPIVRLAKCGKMRDSQNQ